MHPKMTAEAERMLTKLRSLQQEADGLQMDVKRWVRSGRDRVCSPNLDLCNKKQTDYRWMSKGEREAERMLVKLRSLQQEADGLQMDVKR